MKELDRVVLEMSLKPFRRTEPAWLRKTCQEAFRQWGPLLAKSKRASVLLWVSDGSELLTWQGDLAASFEWAKYLGFCNTITMPTPEMNSRRSEWRDHMRRLLRS